MPLPQRAREIPPKAGVSQVYIYLLILKSHNVFVFVCDSVIFYGDQTGFHPLSYGNLRTNSTLDNKNYMMEFQWQLLVDKTSFI